MMRLFKRAFSRRSSSAAPSAHPVPDETSIGHILLKMGVVTREQLASIIDQKTIHDEMLLGALLKQARFCTDEQVARALLIQARLRAGEKTLAALELLEGHIQQLQTGEEAMQVEICKLAEGEERISCEIEKQRRATPPNGLWLVRTPA